MGRNWIKELAEEAKHRDTLDELRAKAKRWRAWANHHPSQETETLARVAEDELQGRERRER